MNQMVFITMKQNKIDSLYEGALYIKPNSFSLLCI